MGEGEISSNGAMDMDGIIVMGGTGGASTPPTPTPTPEWSDDDEIADGLLTTAEAAV